MRAGFPALFFMKPILIIKAGTTFDLLRKTDGDFDDWIIAASGKSRQEFIVTPVYDNILLPQPDYISGVIISGSHANVTEKLPWMERILHWFNSAAKRNVPMLGICFGHQLLARAFGGKVGFNPGGLEIGTSEIQLMVTAKTDLLFNNLPSHFPAFTSHEQTVLKLPVEAENLAFSSKDKHQAFRLYENIWGVQFHPEFNCRISTAYITRHRKDLLNAQQDPAELITSCKDTEWGTHLLKQFVKIVENS